MTVPLSANSEAARLARELVDEHRDHLAPEVVADARLLVTEIVTNAVRYGRPDITLAMRVAPPGLGIVVTDTGADMPRLASETPSPDQTFGRGLLIVNAIASAWGVAANTPSPGKAVWFELVPG